MPSGTFMLYPLFTAEMGRSDQLRIFAVTSPVSDIIIYMEYSGGSRISRREGVHPLGGGVDLRCGHFSVKMYVKRKELGPIGGGVRPACPPPISTNAFLHFS